MYEKVKCIKENQFVNLICEIPMYYQLNFLSIFFLQARHLTEANLQNKLNNPGIPLKN